MTFLRLPTIGKPLKRKRLYDTSLLAKAYRDVREHGLSVYKAARLYGVPESTLRDRHLGIQPVTSVEELLPNPGPKPTFTEQEEKQLVEHIAYMSGIGYGYSRAEFFNLAQDYAVTLGHKKQNDPEFSDSWYAGFKKRNPDVTITKPQKLSIVRAKSTSEETLDKYFNELGRVLQKYDFEEHPEYIWNVDETGLLMEHNPRHVICCKGQAPQGITSNRGKTVTIIASGSAAGTRLPPYYIFPGMRWNQELLSGACPGSAGTVTETGWSNSLVFMNFLDQHFKKHVSIQDHPVLVLFDGHKSHVNLTLAKWGEENIVVFFVLPPHTSHITQPLDVGCFGPLKNVYYSECQAYMRRNPGLQVNRLNIAEISSKAYNKGVSAENLIGAFRKTGIYPLHRQQISTSKTAPSVIYIDKPEVSQADKTSDKGNQFLEDIKIKKALKPKVQKRSLPSVMGDISSPSKKALMKPMPTENGDASKSKKSKVKPVNVKSPVPGPSGVQLCAIESDSEDDHIEETELCCMCKKFTPEPMNLVYTVEFTKWAQCYKCDHWTHLKYCSEVKTLRRGDNFLCPHCN